ncbi:MAG: zinc finger domain-containing protein, partial [Oligoflexales bacterium]
RNEILFFAGVHPDPTICSLDQEAISKLAHAIREIPTRSYKSGGFTRHVSEYGDLTKVEEPKKHRFYVYGRMNLPCYRCKTKIKRISDSSQPLYICPSCQGL